MRRVLIISHADADGHLIAEQTRRNLDLIPSFSVDVFVDPVATKDHNFWNKIDDFEFIKSYDYIFFVDIMFAPNSFRAEAEKLVSFVSILPEKRFFLIDHHPLPYYRLRLATNLRAHYRPDVFDCAIGPRSGMMVVAAICEKQSARVAEVTEPAHKRLAVGMRRAAAPGGPLPGNKLLALLRAGAWQSLDQIGREELRYHRLPRGRRSAKSLPSKALNDADAAAAELLARHQLAQLEHNVSGESAMPYDSDTSTNLDVGHDRYVQLEPSRVSRRNSKFASSDLEAILTLLEVAALSLTEEPGATFSLSDLIQEAQKLGGDEISIRERDIKIVLGKTGFLRKAGQYYSLR